MRTLEKFLLLNLQLFAEGGDGGTGEAGETGVEATDAEPQNDEDTAAEEEYGDIETSDEEEEPDRNAEFERLIKEDYKDLYDAKVQDTIQKRLKNTKETVDKFNKLTPLLNLLSERYGVDSSDIDALSSAIEDDDRYYEDEALELGLPVDKLKSIKKMERENAEFKRQMEEREVQDNARKIFDDWMQQGETLKQIYPDFDFETEMQNPKFVDLLRSNIDVRTAFEVLHRDEIWGSAMQYTAQKAKQKVVNSIIANGNRPKENGTGSKASAAVGTDVSRLSDKDLEDYIRRAKQGERITFR